MSATEFTLPRAPDDLCFTAEDFISPSFNVDNFLHEHRKSATLETMRDDLGVYLKILRSAMIELINKDYADFVNLSKDLIGLDKEIDKLQLPLGQIREEVVQIRQTLDAATVEIYNGIEEHRRIREEKQSINSLSRVYKSIKKLRQILSSTENLPLDKLERAATEYNQLKFHSSRCRQYVSPEISEDVGAIEVELMKSLDDKFLHFLAEKERERLSRCLRIYVSLEKIPEAEALVRTRIVCPIINGIIVEKNIYNEPMGLQGLYDKLIAILNNELKELLEVTLEPDKSGKGFNFVVNSYWVEIEETIELRLKVIFAAGNPELFHQRYRETLDYLRRIEEKCNEKVLEDFRKHFSYVRFMKKWNLPVYYQIRFQEIAGAVEDALGESEAKLQNGEFSLKQSEVAWSSIEKVWSDGIFLEQLLHQFWKLNLQICSRYRVWAVDALRRNEGERRLDFLVHLYSDVGKFGDKFCGILRFAEGKIGGVFPAVEGILRESVEEVRASFSGDLPKITEEIVGELLKKSLPILKQVSDIPRLFRRTMRERPTMPCGYVRSAISSLTEFHGKYQHVGRGDVDQWMLETLTQMTEQYFSSVKDVLESVQKTEESLRRLKKIRDKSSGTAQPENPGITDDEKIRIQLEIDVRTFCDSVKSFNIDISSITRLDELIEMVEAAVRNKT